MAIDTTEAQLQGIGKGAAQVWGVNRGLQYLQQQYQQDQLRRQKEDAEIADQVSKINYDAARNADLPEILKRYGDIKNTFTRLRGTTDTMDRIKLQAELNEKKAELSRGVNLSKQAAQQLGDLGKLRLTHADEISDDFTPNYKSLNELSVFDPKFTEVAERTASTALLPKFDQLSIAKKLADASVKKISESGVKSEKVGDGTSYYTESGQVLDKDALIDNTALEASRNRGMQSQIKKLYPDMPFVDAVKAYAEDLYEGMKGSYDEVKRAGASVVKPDNWKEKALFNDALARKRKADGMSDDDVVSYDRQEWVRGMLNKAPETGERLKAVAKGKGYDKDLNIQWQGNNLVIAVPAKTTEKRVTKDGGEESITETKIPAKVVTINTKDPNAESQLNALVSEVTGDKISETKFKTGNASGKIKGGTSKTTTKTATMSQVKSLIGKKGYEGYTEKELVDYYKSQGYTIK